uniref:MHD1 domain-containing protein n=2 Tax=Lotharella globosa TaxID=91324 RepID=A0A7S3YYJ6_9EUKA
MKKNPEHVAALLEKDQKSLSGDDTLGYAEILGRSKIDIPFFVTTASLKPYKTWMDVVKVDVNTLLTNAITQASRDTYNDFVTLTEPQKSVTGSLRLTFGKIAKFLESNLNGLNSRSKIFLTVEANGKRRNVPNIKVTDSSFPKEAFVVFNELPLSSHITIEVHEDFLFNDRLVGTITLDLNSLHRDKQFREKTKGGEVDLDSIEVQTVDKEDAKTGLRSERSESLSITNSNRGSTEKVVFSMFDQYPLGYPAKVSSGEVTGVVEIQLDFEETKSMDTAPQPTTDSKQELYYAGGIKEVCDAPQLQNVLLAVIQEVEADVAIHPKVQREFKLDLKGLTMQEYYTSARVGLQFLLRRDEYEEDESVASKGLSHQMLGLYKLMRDFIDLLAKNGFDLSKGAGNIEPLFEPYVSGWIEGRRNQQRFQGIPQLVRMEEKWEKPMATLGGDEAADEETLHSPIVTAVFTNFNRLINAFYNNYPYTDSNRNELMTMLGEVTKNSLIQEMAEVLEEKLKLIDHAFAGKDARHKSLWGVQPEGKRLVSVIPQGVFMLLNTIDIAVEEVAHLFRTRAEEDFEDFKRTERAHSDAVDLKEDVHYSSTINCEETAKAFEKYGLRKLWDEILEARTDAFQILVRRIVNFPLSSCAGILASAKNAKKKDGIIANSHKAFQHWQLYLNTFLAGDKGQFAQKMYPHVFLLMAQLTLEALVGQGRGIEGQMVTMLNERPPKFYHTRADFLAQTAGKFYKYFGTEGLDLEPSQLKTAFDEFQRLSKILEVVTRPSRILMQEGKNGENGLRVPPELDGKVASHMKKEEKARQLEEFRVENPPYIYRPTVLQILKYRHFEIKDVSSKQTNPIPNDNCS